MLEILVPAEESKLKRELHEYLATHIFKRSCICIQCRLTTDCGDL
jgi:hypothetical protein